MNMIVSAEMEYKLVKLHRINEVRQTPITHENTEKRRQIPCSHLDPGPENRLDVILPEPMWCQRPLSGRGHPSPTQKLIVKSRVSKNCA